jgi:hypothetical protein
MSEKEQALVMVHISCDPRNFLISGENISEGELDDCI